MNGERKTGTHNSVLTNSWTFSAIWLKICFLKSLSVLSMIESMVSLKVAKSL